MASWFDDVVKPVYRKWFLNRGVHVETEREVLAHTRTIDLIADLHQQNRRLLVGTCFDYFRALNIVEFKGAGDPLTEKDYARLMSRAWGAVMEERLAEDESPIGGGQAKKGSRGHERTPSPIDRTVTIVCITRPRAILNAAARGYPFERTGEPGIYLNPEMPTTRIIVPYEMELVARNYPLMPLSTGHKLKVFVQMCAQQGRSDLLHMSLELADVTGALAAWPQIMEEAGMKSPYTPEVLDVIEQGIRKLPDLPTNKRLREAETMLSQAEEVARRAEVNGALGEMHRTVLRMAERRFGRVPENVTRRVESSQDISQLNRWLDQVVDASALEETDLGEPGEH